MRLTRHCVPTTMPIARFTVRFVTRTFNPMFDEYRFVCVSTFKHRQLWYNAVRPVCESVITKYDHVPPRIRRRSQWRPPSLNYNILLYFVVVESARGDTVRTPETSTRVSPPATTARLSRPPTTEIPPIVTDRFCLVFRCRVVILRSTTRTLISCVRTSPNVFFYRTPNVIRF